MSGEGEARAVDAVLFDLDGTLVDSESMIATTLVDALRDEGHAVTVEQVRAVFGIPFLEMIRMLMGGNASDEQVQRVQDVYRAYAVDRRPLVGPMPGAVALLDALAMSDMPLGVVTNAFEGSVAARLAAFGWEQRFGVVVTADTTTRPKPAPDPALDALRVLGVAPARAAFVGDTEADMNCARDAGIPLIIGLVGTRTEQWLRAEGATHTVDSLDEVLPLLVGTTEVAR